jgi:hypothetical protein
MQRLDPLLKSHLSIYRNIQDQIYSYSVSEGKSIHRYRSNFAIGRKFHFLQSSIRNLLSAANEKKYIFVGDFHPFAQSQKGFLRLLKMIRPQSNLCVAMECIFESHQNKVDAYLSSKITLNELREEIQFDTHWPFPWEDYSQIILYCKEKKIPLIGINLKSPQASLSQRDNFATKILKLFSGKNPNRKILCFIGDFHLGKGHLPSHFSKNDRMVIHQNLDQLFFKAQKRFSQVPEVIKISQNEFCIFNSLPWMKAQSYLDWLEGNKEDSASVDAHEQIYQFSEILSSSLTVKYKRENELSIFISPQVPARIEQKEKNIFKNSARFFRTNLLPKSKIVYLHALTSNSKTEAAALNFWHSLNTQSEIKKISLNKRFFIFSYFIGFLGSKILNPHRKCNEVPDLLSIVKSGTKTKAGLRKKIISENALLELKKFLPENFKANRHEIDETDQIECYRLVGYILANRIYHSKKNRELGQRDLRDFFVEKSFAKHLSKIRKILKKSKNIPKAKSQTL